MANIDKSKREFDIAFKCGKDVTFEVRYYRCSTNAEPFFSTMAVIYNSNHSGMLSGPEGGAGQCQSSALLMNGEFLPKNQHTKFMSFWKKWDIHHLHGLTEKQLNELEADISELKSTGAPFIEAADGANENYITDQSDELVKCKPHAAYRIKWDTDGVSFADCDLPRGSVILPYGMTSGEDISDWLSEKFGYCHAGFLTNFKTDEECELTPQPPEPIKTQTEVHIEKVLYIIHPSFGNNHTRPYGAFLVSDGLDTKKCRTKGDMVGDEGPQYITFKRKRYKVTITGRAGNELISLKPME